MFCTRPVPNKKPTFNVGDIVRFTDYSSEHRNAFARISHMNETSLYITTIGKGLDGDIEKLRVSYHSISKNFML